MATNQLNKYVWLVETIYRARRISLKEINRRWLANDMSDGLEIPERTFHKWRIAVEEGSTLVRLGTSIFGPRDYSKKQL